MARKKTTPAASRPNYTFITLAALAAASTVAVSMRMNVEAFTRHVGGAWGVAVGVAIPLWILFLTYEAHAMLGVRNKVRGHDLPLLSIGCGVLAGFALLVSLPHLVEGFEAWGLPSYQAWSLAVVADTLQVAAKLGIIAAIHPGK